MHAVISRTNLIFTYKRKEKTKKFKLNFLFQICIATEKTKTDQLDQS